VSDHFFLGKKGIIAFVPTVNFKLRLIYERMSLSVSGQNYESVRVDRTRNLDAPFVKWIMKKCELDQEIATFEEKLLNLKTEILLCIEKLNNVDYKNVLVMHYVNGCTWDEVAKKLYVGRRLCLDGTNKG
jgi:hypothetical protein